MYKVLLCWRYLRTRYLAMVCIVSVMLGVATLIVVNSVMSGFSTKLRERLHGLLSDVLIEARGMDGTVLRYGHLYGPGTYYAPDGMIADAVRARGLPLAGEGRGVFSFTHVDDAARAALAAIEAPPGIYNVVDDDPAEARDWLPLYARSLGAPEPEWIDEAEALERLGWTQLHRLTEQRGASNSRARERLGWRPSHPSWRRELEGSAPGADDG